MWELDDSTFGQPRRKWKACEGASIDDLARRPEVELDPDEARFWLKNEETGTLNGTDSEIQIGKIYSTPNTIWSGNFLRPPGESRKSFHVAGSLGQKASEKGPREEGNMIKRAETAVELLSGILSDRQDLCGIIVYGHGGPSGYLGDGSWEPGNHINQADLIRCLQGSFQIAWANVRQCYGLKDAFEAGKIPDSLDDIKYFNVKLMQNIELQ